MKTQVIITIEHPDAMDSQWVTADVIRPFINDVNADSNNEWSFTVASTQTEDELRDKAIRTAFDLTLSEYPRDLDSEWVIDAILNGDDRIIVWDVLESLDAEYIVFQIKETAKAIYNTYFQ